MSEKDSRLTSFEPRMLTWRYIIALSTIAILSIIGFLIVYFKLNEQSADAHIFSIATNQKHYVQQLNTVLRELGEADDSLAISMCISRIQMVEGMLTTYHDKLNEYFIRQDTLVSPVSEALYFLHKSQPELRQINGQVRELLKLATASGSRDFLAAAIIRAARRIEIHGAAYLEKISELTYFYNQALGIRVEEIRRQEMGILLVLLLVLLLEGMLVFRPAIKHIKLFLEERANAIKTLESEISERKNIEKALRQSESDLRGLFDNAHDSIILFKLSDHSILEVNEKACEVYGYKPEEFRRMRVEKLIQKPSRVHNLIHETVLKGSSSHFEMIQISRDGRERLMDVNTAVVNYKEEKAILSIHRDITDSRLAERALRASEEKYSNLFQFSNDCIIIHDLSGRILDCNEQVLSRFGILDAEVTSLNITRFYAHGMREQLGIWMKELVKDGFARFQAIVRTKKGMEFPAEVSCNLFKIGGRKVVQAVFRDITERDAAERRQRALYRIAEITSYSDDINEFYASIHKVVAQLMYAENFYIALYDHSSKILQCPYFIDEFDNFPEPRRDARGLTEYIIETQQPLLLSQEQLQEKMEQGVFKVYGRLAVDWLGVPLTRGESSIGAIVVQSYDEAIRFTEKDKELLNFVGQHIAAAVERKQAIQQLGDERERLRATMLNIADGVITTDGQNNILLMNRVAEEITGFLQQDAIGRYITDILPVSTEKKQDKRLNPADDVLNSGKIVEFNRLLLHSIFDGPRQLSLSVAPIYGENDVTIGTVLAFRDITEQQKMEEELQKALKLESVGKLAGGIAHDFNNYLTAIVGNIALAKLDAGISGNSLQRLGEAESASSRARDLTQQLLTFSKGGAPVKKTASVADLVRETVTFTLRGSQVYCNFEIADDLWPIEADEGQISQVINNIVINSMHAMKKQGRIYINCTNFPITSEQEYPHLHLPPGNYLRLQLADEGEGIPEEHLQKIFDPYFTTKQQGSGLGLATCYSIISKHDGYIGVDSILGEGTVFTIVLPATPDALVETRELEGEVLTGEGQVLIMDDEKSIRDLLGQMLNRLGYAVSMARDGEEAIRLYQEAMHNKSKYDVVIMDLTIPGGLGGRDAIKKLLEIDPEVRAIVSSGYSNDPVMSDYEAYGFAACVAKPFNLHDIGSALQRIAQHTKLSSHSSTES